MKKSFITFATALMVTIFTPFASFAEVVRIEIAGTLNTLLPETVTEVTIDGAINGTDIKYLRHLINDCSLTSMDMTDARFVAGGDAYFVKNDVEYKLDRNDVMGDYMFANCKNLKSLRLSRTIKELCWSVFSNTGITEIDVPDNIITMDWIDFGYCSNLVKVTLGKGLTHLKNSVFDSSPVKHVYVKTLTPPDLGDYKNTFTSNPTIHVYKELVADYEKSSWSKFGTIVGDLEDYYPEDKDPVLAQRSFLKEVFSDGACTTLNASYQSMSDGMLISAIKGAGFDDEFANYILKIKNNSWDIYEKDFRIQYYQPYSDASYWRTKLKIYGGSYMGNPTGIYTQASQKLYVFVDQEIPENAKLSLVGCKGKDVIGLTIAADGTKLSKGLNIIEGEADALYYIVYTVDTKSMTKTVSEWPDMKIHIEGGVVNGYYDATHHNDAEYQAMLSNATHERFIVKGSQSLFIFKTETFRKAWPTSIDASIQWFEDLSMWEREVTGICETVANGSRSGAPFYLSGGESYFPLYYNNPACAIEGDALDVGLANASWYRTSYNSYEAISQSFDVNRIDFDDWCAAHEVGHSNQGAINLEGCTEVSNNMFSNIVGFHSGTTVSRGLPVSITMNDYVEHKPFVLRDIWSMTRMYYQLYLYYHQAHKNTAFFPTLFEELRNDPLVLWESADMSLLKFVRKVCKVANEDLSDFFRAWGFFEPYTGTITDYGANTVTVNQADIDATLAEISRYPRKNREILFIEDRISDIPPTGYIPSITVRKPSSDGGVVGQCGNMGQFTDYVTGTAPSEAKYAQYDNLFSFSCKGAVGILVLDDKENLLFASNRSNFEMPESVLSQNYRLYCVASDGSLTEARKVTSGSKKIEVSTPGTFATLLPTAALCPMLELSGLLNGSDILHLRKLIVEEALGVVDLSNARIVAGGEEYFEEYTTIEDYIGNSMFKDYKNLTSIALPKNLKRVDVRGFSGSDLREIDIPDTVNRLAYMSFAYCKDLKTVTIGKNVVNMEVAVFYNSDIEDVYVKPMTPPKLDGYTFTSNPTIHVCKEALASYQTSAWADYGTIVGDLEPYDFTVNDIVKFISLGSYAQDFDKNGKIDEGDLQWLIARILKNTK